MKKLWILLAGIALLSGCTKTDEMDEEPMTRAGKPQLWVNLNFSFSNNTMTVSSSIDTGATIAYVIQGKIYHLSGTSSDPLSFSVTSTGSGLNSGHSSYSGVNKASNSFIDMPSLSITSSNMNLNDFEIVWVINGLPKTVSPSLLPTNTIRPKWNGTTWYFEADNVVTSNISIQNDSIPATWVIRSGQKTVQTNVRDGKINIWSISPTQDNYYRYNYIEYAEVPQTY